MVRFRSDGAAAVGVLVLAIGANGAIVGVGGSVELVAAPADARPDAFTSDTKIRAWNERQNVLLAADLLVDAVSAGTYDEESDLGAFRVLTGQTVSSHYVHYDSEGAQETISAGSVVFDQDIVGVIVLGDKDESFRHHLMASDYLGNPSTIYPVNSFHRGLELAPTLDRFTIMPDQRTLNLDNLFIYYPGDAVRIVTRGDVPAPAGALALVGAALATLRRRR